MEASAAAFKIISSSLYERKEEAVIRELSANALDAHIEAGNTNIPVVIQLPSTMNPSLIIRDVGIGMSLDTVRDVLTSYFKSNQNIRQRTSRRIRTRFQITIRNLRVLHRRNRPQGLTHRTSYLIR
jgi:HSP90 family molecular chaperone